MAISNDVPKKSMEGKSELINIQVTREKIAEIVELQHEKYSKVELSRMGQSMMALAFVQGAKALLSVVDKETAKKALAKAVYDFAFMGARAAAEERGNPKDLKSYKEFQYEGMGVFPFIPPIEIIEDTQTRLVGGIQICPFADAVRNMAETLPNYVDRDVLEVVCSRCETLDSGRANGFNPDMKFKRTHFKLGDMIGETPSEGCCFEFETYEE